MLRHARPPRQPQEKALSKYAQGGGVEHRHRVLPEGRRETAHRHRTCHLFPGSYRVDDLETAEEVSEECEQERLQDQIIESRQTRES